MKKLIAGNWKMNGSAEAANTLIEDIVMRLNQDKKLHETCDFVVCPPYIHLQVVRNAIEESHAGVSLGAQDCALNNNGAFTGDISAEMLKDFGCNYVILGHSERRQHHGESNETIAAKAVKAHEKGLITIICVGEKENERDAGFEQDVVADHLKNSIPDCATAANTVIAYEPVWAIGTGKTATPYDVEVMHKFIREQLKQRFADGDQMRILYGGSVKPDNAKALFEVAHVNGALIGGASLKATDYLAIAAGA